MNKWNEIKKTAIVEADDFQDKFDRNGLNYLFYWRAKYPDFKITLFTIPNKISDEMFDMLVEQDWIEFAVHGFDHDSNFECYGWDYDKTKVLMERVISKNYWVKIFKSPGWTITPTAYPAAPEDPINNDPQAVYKALNDMNFIIVDRHYNKEKRPAGGKYICVDCNPNIVHMHTWNMMTPDPDERNGFEQVEMRGVPWNHNTKFYFMSEAYEEGLIKPCK